MRTSEALTDFLEYLEIEQNRSQKTIANYHHYLQRLVEFNNDCNVSAVNAELIRKWRLSLNRILDNDGSPLSKTTQNYHLIALRSFLRYLTKRDLEVLASDKIELARVQRPEVNFLSEGELERLFEAPDTSKLIGLRDKTILELLFSSGLRVSELVGLNRDHINLKIREFSVRGKGQKDRTIFISPEAADWIQ